MNYWLAKTEPSQYSIDDLAKDRIAEWDGVTNPVAVANLKRMENGDKVIIYHSGEKTFAGLAEVVGEGKPDLKQPKSWSAGFKPSSTANNATGTSVVQTGVGRPDPTNPKSWWQTFRFIRKFKEPLVTLEEIKAHPEFSDWVLLRQGRLSVMAVPEEIVKWLKLKGFDL